MPKFRKKPVEIEAVEWKGPESWPAVLAMAPDASDKVFLFDHLSVDLQIRTLEGVMTASPGDWVIRGVKNELYPCKPDIFAATYEASPVDLADVDTDGLIATSFAVGWPEESATSREDA